MSSIQGDRENTSNRFYFYSALTPNIADACAHQQISLQFSILLKVGFFRSDPFSSGIFDCFGVYTYTDTSHTSDTRRTRWI